MQNHFDDARKALAQAVAADDKYVPSYVVLAQVAAKQNNWEEVVSVSDRAVALDSLDFPLAFFYNAVAHFNIGDLDPAEQSARRGLRIDPQHKVPTLELILASILQQKNRYAESAEHFRAYLQLAPNAPNASSVRSQLAEVEKQLRGASNASPPTPK
jgi:tetratricopeptide (TPR) repeat protein